MTNFQDILKRAIQIRDAVSEGANTASLVGGVMVDTLYNQNKLKQDIDSIIDSLKDLSKSDSSGGIDEITLANYLIRNGYAKKSDIPTSWWGQVKDENNEVKGALHNVLSLLFSDSEIEITGVANDDTPISSNEKIVTPSYAASKFLSKLEDDVANGTITFEKMQKFLCGFVSAGRAILQQGFAIDEEGYGFDENGNIVADSLKSLNFNKALNEGFGLELNGNQSHLYLSHLTVWGKMMINILEIMKTKYAGGNIYLSAAGGTIVKVVPVIYDDEDGEWHETSDELCRGWQCYILADDGDDATTNPWREGDQVRCQAMGNLSGGIASQATNKSYWRTIPENGVSPFNEYIYNEDGRPAYDGKMFYWIVLGKHSENFDGYTEENAPTGTTDIPEAGDSIVLDGSRKDASRQGVLQLSSYGSGAPSIVGLHGVCKYTHDGCATYELSYDNVLILAERFKLIAKSGDSVEITNFRGEWNPTEKYYKNDQVSHNNAIWTCLTDNTTSEPTDESTDWRKEVYGQKGEDGSSFKVLGTADGHFESYDQLIGSSFVGGKQYLVDDASGFGGTESPSVVMYQNTSDTWYICKSNDGDSYMIGDNLWTNSGSAWLNIGNVKGVSISSTSITYGISASGTEQPASWQSTLPTATDSRPYLWTRTIVSYTDDTSTTSYSVGYKGKNGTNGKDAVSIMLMPSVLVFDAGSDGIVPSGVSKSAALIVRRGNSNIASEIASVSATSNVSNYDDKASVSSSGNLWVVKLSSSHISKVDVGEGDTATQVSATSGFVTVSVKLTNNEAYLVQVSFQVNVAKFMGQLTLTNKDFEVSMKSLTTKVGELPTQSDLERVETSISSTAEQVSLKAIEANNNKFKAAGLEVKADGVTLYGDKITITNDNGKTTTALFAGGKINASLIDADQIEVKHLWAKSGDGATKVGYFGNTEEDACKLSDGTLAPLFIGGATAEDSPFYVTYDGSVHATSGYIGSLRILNGGLYGGSSQQNLSLRTDHLTFREESHKIKASVGADWTGGIFQYMAMQAIVEYDHPTKLVYIGGGQPAQNQKNIALYVKASGTKHQYSRDLWQTNSETPCGNHAIFCESGDFAGFRPCFRAITASQTLTKYDVFLEIVENFKIHNDSTGQDTITSVGEVTLSLPENPEIGQMYWIIRSSKYIYSIKTTDGTLIYAPDGGHTIVTLKTANEMACIVYTGSNWRLMWNMGV